MPPGGLHLGGWGPHGGCNWGRYWGRWSSIAISGLHRFPTPIPQRDFGPIPAPPDPAKLRAALAAARADQSLTRREREEVDLLDAKIDMRCGAPEDGPGELLRSAEKKLRFRSEARGWLAHIHYLFGEQTVAGKMYLDELNRNGSNLSRETLLNSCV